jgi:hypothetical protein
VRQPRSARARAARTHWRLTVEKPTGRVFVVKVEGGDERAARHLVERALPGWAVLACTPRPPAERGDG